jgi:hypothetical protein
VSHREAFHRLFIDCISPSPQIFSLHLHEVNCRMFYQTKIQMFSVQVFNEPELSSTWDIGALFTDDEIFSKFEKMIDLVESHNLSAKLYTNFSVGYVLRSNVPIELSKRLDFVGLDIFMEAFLILSPHFIQNLQK